MHMCMGLKLRERMLRMLRGVCATSPNWNQPRCLLTVRINVLRGDSGAPGRRNLER